MVVDSGSTLFGTPLSLSAEGKPLVEAMNIMEYDAMNVSAQDLVLGIDTLLALSEQAHFPFVSANLVKEDGSLVFEPYTIVNKGNLRIGVIGIIEPIEEILTQAPDMKGIIRTLDPAQTLEQYIGELTPQVDLIVVLSHLGLTRDKTLATIPGIDVIIGGGDRIVMKEPVRVGSTIIVQQGFQGEWIGRTVLELDNHHDTIASTTEYIALTSEYQDDPELAKLVARWEALYPTPTSE